MNVPPTKYAFVPDSQIQNRKLQWNDYVATTTQGKLNVQF